MQQQCVLSHVPSRRTGAAGSMSVNLEGNVLVTGANRGIGLELVRQLLDRRTGKGVHVYACCREPRGVRAEALMQLTTQHPGKITVIKMATGKRDMMEVYETNVVGPFILSKMFLPLLQRAAERFPTDPQNEMSCRRSAIINMSTLISSIEKCPETFPVAQMYPYRTSK
ncbi:unnamed protein product, partial [Menidia menidia]